MSESCSLWVGIRVRKCCSPWVVWFVPKNCSLRIAELVSLWGKAVHGSVTSGALHLAASCFFHISRSSLTLFSFIFIHILLFSSNDFQPCEEASIWIAQRSSSCCRQPGLFWWIFIWWRLCIRPAAMLLLPMCKTEGFRITACWKRKNCVFWVVGDFTCMCFTGEREKERERERDGAAAMYSTYHRNHRDRRRYHHNHSNVRFITASPRQRSSTLAPVTIKPPLSDIPSLAPAYELFTLSTQILSLFPQ